MCFIIGYEFVCGKADVSSISVLLFRVILLEFGFFKITEWIAKFPSINKSINSNLQIQNKLWISNEFQDPHYYYLGTFTRSK